MTCRYGHKRVALLFTMVQATPVARVIEWPQKPSVNGEPKVRTASPGKSQQEISYASK